MRIRWTLPAADDLQNIKITERKTGADAFLVSQRVEFGRVAQTCIFSACLRFSEGTAPRFPAVIRAVLEAGRPDSPFGSMIADLL